MNIWSRNQLGSPNPRPRTHIGRSCSLQPWSKSSMKITSGNKSCQHHFRNRRLCCNPHSHITMAFPKNWLLTGSAKFAKQILQPMHHFLANDSYITIWLVTCLFLWLLFTGLFLCAVVVWQWETQKRSYHSLKHNNMFQTLDPLYDAKKKWDGGRLIHSVTAHSPFRSYAPISNRKVKQDYTESHTTMIGARGTLSFHI